MFTLPTEGRIDSNFVCFFHGVRINVDQIKLLFKHTIKNEATNLAKIERHKKTCLKLKDYMNRVLLFHKVT